MAKAIDEPVLEPQRTDLKSGDLEEVIRDVERVQLNLSNEMNRINEQLHQLQQETAQRKAAAALPGGTSPDARSLKKKPDDQHILMKVEVDIPGREPAVKSFDLDLSGSLAPDKSPASPENAEKRDQGLKPEITANGSQPTLEIHQEPETDLTGAPSTKVEISIPSNSLVMPEEEENRLDPPVGRSEEPKEPEKGAESPMPKLPKTEDTEEEKQQSIPLIPIEKAESKEDEPEQLVPAEGKEGEDSPSAVVMQPKETLEPDASRQKLDKNDRQNDPSTTTTTTTEGPSTTAVPTTSKSTPTSTTTTTTTESPSTTEGSNPSPTEGSNPSTKEPAGTTTKPPNPQRPNVIYCLYPNCSPSHLFSVSSFKYFSFGLTPTN